MEKRGTKNKEATGQNEIRMEEHTGSAQQGRKVKDNIGSKTQASVAKLS